MKKTILSTQYNIKDLLPDRYKNDHKAIAGKALIIAGGKGLCGAALLSAQACARSGVGYTYLLTQTPNQVLQHYPDFITYKLSLIHLKQVLKHNQFSVIVIGPGLGLKNKSLKISILKQVLKNTKIPIILDADAITLVFENKSLVSLISQHGQCVLTPHLKELQRILQSEYFKMNKIKTQPPVNLSQKGFEFDFKNNTHRELVLKDCSEKLNAILVLKGPNTTVLGKNYIFHSEQNPFPGTSALAKAGTGDVLSGVLAGMIAGHVAKTKKTNPVQNKKKYNLFKTNIIENTKSNKNLNFDRIISDKDLYMSCVGAVGLHNYMSNMFLTWNIITNSPWSLKLRKTDQEFIKSYSRTQKEKHLKHLFLTDKVGLIASDLVKMIPYAVYDLKNKKNIKLTVKKMTLDRSR